MRWQGNKYLFDKVSSLTQKSVEIIQKSSIINLYPNGGELFGRCWNKKDNTQ